MDTHHNSSTSVPPPLPASSSTGSAGVGAGSGAGHTSTSAGSTPANTTGSTTTNATQGLNSTTKTNTDHIDNNIQISSNYSSGSVIQSYPFTDTLAIVSILYLLPNWLSVLLLLLYVSLGTPKFVLKFLDLSFNYLTNSSRCNNTNNNNNLSTTDDINDLDHDEMDTSMSMEDQITSNDEITVSFNELISTICWLLLDCLIVFIILLISPNILPYINLLSMSFVSSNIASTKNRTILNAILSALTIILIDFLFKYLINYYDFLDISSNSSSSSNSNSNSIFTTSYFDYSNSLLNYQRRPLSLLSYRISLSGINSINSVNSYSDLLSSTPLSSSSSSSSSSSTYFILSSIFRIIFQMDYLIEFLHSTLSIYTIMHNLNPFLQKSLIISSLTKYLDNLTKKTNNAKKLFTNNNNNILDSINNSNNNNNINTNTNTDLTNNTTNNNNTNTTTNNNTTTIDSQYNNNDNQLKNNINNNSHINDSNHQDIYDEFDEYDDIDSKYHTTNINNNNPISSSSSSPAANNLNNFSNSSSSTNKYSKRKNDLQKIRIPTDIAHSILPLTTYQHRLKLLKNSKNSNDGNSNNSTNGNGNNNSGNGNTEDDDNVPASFPVNHHEIHINDISTSSVVVSYNFENYCKIAIFPSSTDFYSKRHFNPILEKKIKSLSNKSQQPIWSFFTAIKAMFTRQDLYSGEYYQYNALVTTRNSPSTSNSTSSSPFASSPYKIREGDITRSLVDEAQCFIWITSETYVAVELLGTTINRILVKVNGVVWHQISSGRMNEREIVIVGGLSPLSQYDIEFINVNIDNELELLAITTISTIHKDMTLTQSKPSSPLSTLQESLVTTNEAIVRERGKLKKLKNDWRKRSSTLKSEIDLLNKRTTIGDESRNYKKVSSLRQAVSKSEEENSKIELNLQEIYNKETEFDEKYLDEKRKYENELRILTSFENEYNKKIDEFLNKIKLIENDKNQLLLKKEKLINKKSKILNDIERIKKEINELKLNEIKFRENNREIRSNTRTQKFKVLSTDINRIEKELTNEYKKMLNDNSN
ncbi:hypothetical protein B5S29_g3245 [[Candida] boidinii]|nr:hypothetical protein B5S29_g3245 [[Candida] boidinii]